MQPSRTRVALRNPPTGQPMKIWSRQPPLRSPKPRRRISRRRGKVQSEGVAAAGGVPGGVAAGAAGVGRAGRPSKQVVCP